MIPIFVTDNSYTLFGGISLLAGVLSAATYKKFNKFTALIFLTILKIHFFLWALKVR